jgi:hypothetical protein
VIHARLRILAIADYFSLPLSLFAACVGRYALLRVVIEGSACQ